MSRTWLLIDCHNAAWRAFHALKKVFDGGPDNVAQPVMFGVLRDVAYYREKLAATHLAFFFDLGQPFRRLVLPTYKVKPEDDDPGKREERAAVHGQIAHLREHVLPEMGFRNVIGEHGYEADDLIASAVQGLPKEDHAVILSSDKDLYQLISRRVSVFTPSTKTLVDEREFVRRHKTSPRLWAKVKALAGDGGDKVPGVPGVGEITAVKYLNSGLAVTTKAYQTIKASRELVLRNKRLVELPYENTPKVKLVPDEPAAAAWDEVVAKYGMGSLRRDPFGGGRPKRKAGV